MHIGCGKDHVENVLQDGRYGKLVLDVEYRICSMWVMQHEWNILKDRKRKSLDLLPTCVPADETKFKQNCREEGSRRYYNIF